MAASHLRPQPAAPAIDAHVPVARPRLASAEAVYPYLQRIDETRWYSNFGPLLTDFETRLAERFTGAAHIVTVTTATQALTLALMAMDLPRGAYVVMPAWTFISLNFAGLLNEP